MKRQRAGASRGAAGPDIDPVRVFEELHANYGSLASDKVYKAVVTGVSQERRKDIEMLRNLVVAAPMVGRRVNEIVALAAVVVEEAEFFERAIMSSPEGRDVVEMLAARNPAMFELTSFRKSKFS